MIVQIQAISDNSRSMQQIEKFLKDRMTEFRARVAAHMVNVIIDESPVDTGTYIMAHVAGPKESSEAPSRSSHGKRRGRNKKQFQGLARGNLMRSVSAKAIQASNEVWFRNRALHAGRVEYLGWNGRLPYRVYAKTRAAYPRIVEQVIGEMGLDRR
jgi:hypothetical protein